MDTWMQDVVSMMAEDTTTVVTLPIKKEEIDTTCCSPSPSTGSSNIQPFVYDNSPVTDMDTSYKCSCEPHPSPGSPDRQFCSSTTTTLNDMCHDMNNQEIKDEQPRRLCLVCGDIASGFHYGVASCEACKAFFKRTIQGNIEYTCPSNGECEINKRRRKACQACRFQKCLLMGMLKEGVRLDRVRGGRQKYRRNPVANPYQQLSHPTTHIPPSSMDEIAMVSVFSVTEPDLFYVGSIGIDLNNWKAKSVISSTSNNSATGSGNSIVSVGNNNIVTMVRNDKSIFEGKSFDAEVIKVLDVLSEIYDNELALVIGWAKQIPGFLELALGDQMRLLQSTWAEILTLQLAYRSIPFTGKLIFGRNFWLDERIASDCGAIDMYNHLAQITRRLEKLSVRKEEYFMLKALILGNSDVSLAEPVALRKFRDTILTSFNDCVFILRYNSAIAHQQQLLLILPALRQADDIIRKYWKAILEKGDITMKKLFVELLTHVSPCSK